MNSRLQQAPFLLSDADVDWVESTLGAMSVEEKIGQVFCLVSYGADEKALRHMAGVLKVGGVMCRSGSAEDVIDTVRLLQESGEVPLLMSGNLEAGGDGVSTDGTRIGSLMAVAATGDVEHGLQAGRRLRPGGFRGGDQLGLCARRRHRLQLPEPHHQHEDLRI